MSVSGSNHARCAVLLLALSALGAPASAGASDPELQFLMKGLTAAEAKARAPLLAKLPRYRLDLELKPEQGALAGTQQITFTADEALTELWLRIPANASWQKHDDRPAVKVSGLKQGQKALKLERRGGMTRVKLDAPVAAGDTVNLQLELQVALPVLSWGDAQAQQQLMHQAMTLFGGQPQDEEVTDYGTFGVNGATTLLAGFILELAPRRQDGFERHEDAGRGEPRWGSPAHYVVSLVTPEGMKVLGTGFEIGRAPEKDGRVCTTRVAAAVRGFALVVSPELEAQEQQAGPVKVVAWGRADQALQRRKVLDTAVRAVKFYANRFGAYPWSTLEVALLPLTGGVECLSFPGLVACSQLLADPQPVYAMYGTPDAEQSVDRVLEANVAHQVAHQWWGGVVGSDRVHRPELDEPLASHAALQYLDHRRGRGAGKAFTDRFMRSAYSMHRMMGQPDLPVARKIGDYRSRNEQEALLRTKGALFYDALRTLVGEKVYLSALKKAAEANWLGDVETDPVVEQAMKLAPDKAGKVGELYARYMKGTFGDEDVANPDFAFGAHGAMQGIDPASMQQLMKALQQMGFDAAGLLGGGGAPDDALGP